MDPVNSSFGSLELSQRQCCLQGKIFWLTSQNKNYGDGKNASGRLKSANSSSKLNNKGCPLICIKDQTILLWILQQAGESGSNGQALQLSAMTTLDMVMGPVRQKIPRLTL